MDAYDEALKQFGLYAESYVFVSMLRNQSDPRVCKIIAVSLAEDYETALDDFKSAGFWFHNFFILKMKAADAATSTGLDVPILAGTGLGVKV